MHHLVKRTVFSALILSLAQSTGAQEAAAPAQSLPAADTGMCHRATTLPPLPVELQQQANVRPTPSTPMTEAKPGVLPPPLVKMMPPPPSPAPPPMAASAMAIADEPGADSIIVSARRVDSRYSDTPVAVTAMSSESLGSRFGPERQPKPKAGLLTAGEHDDLLNPELYADYVAKSRLGKAIPGLPAFDTRRMVTVRVVDTQGKPIPFAKVTLTCADGNALSLATFADGVAAFFPDIDRLGAKVTMTAKVGNALVAPSREIAIDPEGRIQREAVTASDGGAVQQFDLALVIDATGSMGDEIAFLKAELGAILESINRRHPDVDVRLGMVVYRDIGDEFITRTYPMTSAKKDIFAPLSTLEAGGGGDMPEAMDQALRRALALNWRPGAVKTMLLVGDAPPHDENVALTWSAAEQARAQRIHITPLAASGVDDRAEYLMRAMAAATQSPYIFLTDDSGIGNPHAPPAIDCYLVTKLQNAVKRVIDGQISGRRIEPGGNEIIRVVGKPRRGRCVLPTGFKPGSEQG